MLVVKDGEEMLIKLLMEIMRQEHGGQTQTQIILLLEKMNTLNLI